jgi:hypothetical protein
MLLPSASAASKFVLSPPRDPIRSPYTLPWQAAQHAFLRMLLAAACSKRLSVPGARFNNPENAECSSLLAMPPMARRPQRTIPSRRRAVTACPTCLSLPAARTGSRSLLGDAAAGVSTPPRDLGHPPHANGSLPNVLVAHLQEGLEVIHLYSGALRGL